jgi:hypothetical protein
MQIRAAQKTTRGILDVSGLVSTNLGRQLQQLSTRLRVYHFKTTFQALVDIVKDRFYTKSFNNS